MSLRTLLVALVLAGCAPDPVPAPDAPAPPASVTPALVTPAPDSADATTEAASLALDSDGLRVVAESGSTTALAFGRPLPDVVAAVSRLRGEPSDQGVSPECGAGPLDVASWPGGLTLYGQNGAFAGWAVGGPASDETLTTMTGAGIGSTRVDLYSAYDVTVQETSLGTEFDAGGLYGLLTGPGPDATVTALWAGVSCNFR